MTAVSFFTPPPPPSTALFQTASSSVANTTTTASTASISSSSSSRRGENHQIVMSDSTADAERSPPKNTSPSVHLRLSEGATPLVVADGTIDQKNLLNVVADDKQEIDNQNTNDNDPQEQQQQQQHSSSSSSSSSSSVVKVHSYTDPATQKTWKALNTAKSKFLSFLQYNNVTSATMSNIVTQETNILVDPTRQQQQEEEEEQQQQQQAAAAAAASIQPLSFMGQTLPSAVTAAAVAASKTTTMNDDTDRDDDSAADSNTASALRKEWRSLWKQRQLLTDRTEFLAVYPSDTASSTNSQSINEQQQQKMKTSRKNQPRRGGFVDLLLLYTERMAAILRDERDDAELHNNNNNNEQGRRLDNQTTTAATSRASTTTITTDQRSLVSWLEENFGQYATHRLQASQLHQYPVDQQLQYWKEFLEWFRSQFPYYYDRCLHCGASIKEDNASNQHAQSSSSEDSSSSSSLSSDDCTHIHHHEDDEEDGQGYQTFVGYVYPDGDELEGKASRTELYRCHKCRQFTRFPRFNSVWHVINERRGRCGEYSMLLFRFLRALGHECRWVVDWADHVWAEVFVPASADSSSTRNTSMYLASLTTVSPFGRSATATSTGRWIHLDPCEAAVDENLIYQGWGKKQTYILGFYAPPKSDDLVSSQTTHSSTDSSWTLPFAMTRTTTTIAAAAPLIQDITFDYTSETWSEINKRRDESEHEVRNAIQKSIVSMRQKIQSIMAPPSPPPSPSAQSNSNNISNNWMTTGLASFSSSSSSSSSTTTKQEDT
jgi:Transglutaminase-like superfamily